MPRKKIITATDLVVALRDHLIAKCGFLLNRDSAYEMIAEVEKYYGSREKTLENIQYVRVNSLTGEVQFP